MRQITVSINDQGLAEARDYSEGSNGEVVPSICANVDKKIEIPVSGGVKIPLICNSVDIAWLTENIGRQFIVIAVPKIQQKELPGFESNTKEDQLQLPESVDDVDEVIELPEAEVVGQGSYDNENIPTGIQAE